MQRSRTLSGRPAVSAGHSPIVANLDLPSPLEIPAGATELEGFLDWCASDAFPPGVKASLINGILRIENSVDHVSHHNILKTEVARALGNLSKATRLGRVLTDGAMYAHRGDGTGNEPDVLLLLWTSLLSRRSAIEARHPGGTEIVRGSADLVVECVSPSSVRKDTVDLPPAYFAAGVREYWILDGRDGLAFTLLTRTEDSTDWDEVAPAADGSRLSPLLDRRVTISQETDPAGGIDWDVRLEEPAGGTSAEQETPPA